MSTKWSFDQEAARWDKNPARVKLAENISDAISKEGILRPNKDVLEFGCGTGLLTLRLAPLVQSVTGVDSSKGMLSVLDSKIESGRLSRVNTRFVDIEKGDILEGTYDIVVCSMTLHHVKEIRPLLRQFHGVLRSRGYLAIADLDPEHGEFHGDNDTVFHEGFDRALLRAALTETGFDDVRDRLAANITKPASDGLIKQFGVFLITGRKMLQSTP